MAVAGHNTALAAADILSYKDYFIVSVHAVPVIQLACGFDYMQGSDGYLNSAPK